MLRRIEKLGESLSRGADNAIAREALLRNFETEGNKGPREKRMSERREEYRKKTEKNIDREIEKGKTAIENVNLLQKVNEKYEDLGYGLDVNLDITEVGSIQAGRGVRKLYENLRKEHQDTVTIKKESNRIVSRIEDYSQAIRSMQKRPFNPKQKIFHRLDESALDVEHHHLKNLERMTKNLREIKKQEFPNIVRFAYAKLYRFPEILQKEIDDLKFSSKKRIDELSLDDGEKNKIKKLIEDIEEAKENNKVSDPFDSGLTNKRIMDVMKIVDKKLSEILREKDKDRKKSEREEAKQEKEEAKRKAEQEKEEAKRKEDEERKGARRKEKEEREEAEDNADLAWRNANTIIKMGEFLLEINDKCQELYELVDGAEGAGLKNFGTNIIKSMDRIEGYIWRLNDAKNLHSLKDKTRNLERISEEEFTKIVTLAEIILKKGVEGKLHLDYTEGRKVENLLRDMTNKRRSDIPIGRIISIMKIVDGKLSDELWLRDQRERESTQADRNLDKIIREAQKKKPQNKKDEETEKVIEGAEEVAEETQEPTQEEGTETTTQQPTETEAREGLGRKRKSGPKFTSKGEKRRNRKRQNDIEREKERRLREGKQGGINNVETQKPSEGKDMMSLVPTKDYYATTLGVSKNATIDEIKAAYRRLRSKHHPDRGGDGKKFAAIKEAYEKLSAKKGNFNV